MNFSRQQLLQCNTEHAFGNSGRRRFLVRSDHERSTWVSVADSIRRLPRRGHRQRSRRGKHRVEDEEEANKSKNETKTDLDNHRLTTCNAPTEETLCDKYASGDKEKTEKAVQDLVSVSSTDTDDDIATNETECDEPSYANQAPVESEEDLSSADDPISCPVFDNLADATSKREPEAAVDATCDWRVVQDSEIKQKGDVVFEESLMGKIRDLTLSL